MNKYVLKRPGENAIVIECKDFDDIRRKLIPDDPENGMVQAVPIIFGYWLLCDEEAKIKNNPPELNILTDMVVGRTILGNVMIVFEKDGDWVSVPEDKIQSVMDWLNEQAKEVKM